MSDAKQVIVMRRDLKMRRGKEIAQSAHASMAFLAKKALAGEAFTEVERSWPSGRLALGPDDAEKIDRVSGQLELY